MKKLVVIIFVCSLVFSSCTSENETAPSRIQEDLDFSYQTTDTTITVMIVQSEQHDDISWYTMLIGKVGDDFENRAAYQDLNNDTLSYKFTDLESNTRYKVKIEGQTYAIGGDIIASDSKEIMTD